MESSPGHTYTIREVHDAAYTANELRRRATRRGWLLNLERGSLATVYISGLDLVSPLGRDDNIVLSSFLEPAKISQPSIMIFKSSLLIAIGFRNDSKWWY